MNTLNLNDTKSESCCVLPLFVQTQQLNHWRRNSRGDGFLKITIKAASRPRRGAALPKGCSAGAVLKARVKILSFVRSIAQTVQHVW